MSPDSFPHRGWGLGTSLIPRLIVGGARLVWGCDYSVLQSWTKAISNITRVGRREKSKMPVSYKTWCCCCSRCDYLCIYDHRLSELEKGKGLTMKMVAQWRIQRSWFIGFE